MVILDQENRRIENISGLLIKHSTDLVMESNGYLMEQQCQFTMRDLNLVSQRQ